FFKATFSVMGFLAKADGRVSETEIKVAQKIMQDLGLNSEMRSEAIHLFNTGKQTDFNMQEVLSQLHQACGGDKRLLNYFLELQFEAALADGALNQFEEKILLNIAKILKLSSLEVQQLWLRMQSYQSFYEFFSQARSGFNARQQGFNQGHRQQQGQYGQHSQPGQSLDHAYGVLGVKPNAAVNEIKQAYRRLMNQHHPDKLVSKGLPPEMLKRAKEKVQEITAAYDLIRQEKGFK
ncbi:MAG: co-chaperone DjlA, partial [Gammaproteobacteria bacterium]